MHGNYQNDGQSKREFKLIRLSELDEQEPEPETVVKRLMPRTGLACIFGAPGSAKTFFAVRMGLCIATGTPFFGSATERGATIYIASEAGSGIKKRVLAARNQVNATREEFDTINHAPFFLITEAPNLGFSDPNDCNPLILSIQKANVGSIRAIFLDTVAKSVPGTDENSATEMGVFVANAERIARHFNTVVIGVHHVGKDAEKGMRGSSALLGALDCGWSIRKEADGTRIARLEKMRDAEDGLSMTFDLEEVDVGDTTSCVINELTFPEIKKVEPKVGELKGQARTAFDALVEVVRERGTIPPESNHIPSRTPTVHLDVWKEHAARRGLCAGDEPDALRKAFARAKDKLIQIKKIGVWDNHVWPVL